ncbi:MAG TPA: amidohydrolase family protein [Bryobacteraceae bacterium]|jgi:imidazolonepropionase|nr:amidohydrolase family protein [Bryobacteraceae bacterium]
MLTLRGPNEPRRGRGLSELNIIHDGSLLVRDGVLVEVGPTRRIENLALAQKAVEVSAVGRVVMPGFVDSHTHLLFPPPGSFASEIADGAHAIRTITGMRLETRARMYVEAMARHGTTTVEVKTGCGPDRSAEMKILRVLAALKQKPLDVVATFLLRMPPGEPETTEAGEWVSSEFLPKIRRRRLAEFADLVWEEPPGRAAHFAEYFRKAKALGMKCKLHADGLVTCSAIATAIESGVTSIDHLEHAATADAEFLGRSGTIATLLPCASFHSESRYAPARVIIEAGAPVALASNFNPRHTPTLNMQAVINLACLRMSMTPAEAITAATINGAHALGCADKLGSLEPGKLADLLILNISDYRELAHHFGTNLVHSTMKRGEFIYEEGSVAPRPARDLRPAW